MSVVHDTDRFAKDPSLLVELCRDVIERLDSNSEEMLAFEQEAQLRVIARAVSQLVESGVSVPEPLRAEKTRLAASLALQAEAKQALAQLADEFQDILNDLRERIGSSDAAGSQSKSRIKRVKLARTSQAVLRARIVAALRHLGGCARVCDVIEAMARELEGKLLPGDMVWREATNEPAWQNNAKWERFQMTQQGILRRGSPRGIWELGEDA